MKKEKEETDDRCPWLEKDDEMRNVLGKEMLGKYVDLEKSCLSETEREKDNGPVVQV